MPVGQELSVDGVADASFEAAECLSFAFTFGEFASVVATAGSVVTDLGDRCDVDGVVELPVPGSVEPVPVDVTG